MFFKSEKEKFKDYVDRFRRKYIPKRYNQIHLVDELMNDELDHYISISNRTDGKSFNYVQFFMQLSIDYDVKFILLSRNFSVRNSYMELIRKIVSLSDAFKPEKLNFLNTQYYAKILYDNKNIGAISDLNSATNLKYSSNYLQDFPIIIYDEFLAIEGDYLPDEWIKLKTIYGSINRVDDIPIIKYPKLFYLGNAVNFSSPILSHLNLFNKLEKHPINTMRQYDNVLLEMINNEYQNEKRNLRAFNEENDSFTRGQFEINKHNIATENDRKALAKNRYTLFIKLQFKYLRIDYNPDNMIIILSIIGSSDDYDFNSEVKDNKDDSIYLKKSYYSDLEEKKHINGLYLYDNDYSKDIITTNYLIYRLKLMKIIGQHYAQEKKNPPFDRMAEKYEQNYIDRTKKNILKKFLNR